MRIVFRADGNSRIGFGHLIRLLAFAEMLKEQYSIVFITEVLSLSHSEATSKITDQHVTLTSSKDSFIDHLKPTDIVILDGYEFNNKIFAEIKNLGCGIIKISDSPEKCPQADVLINHSPTLDWRDYQLSLRTRLYGGTDYALLRPAFLNQSRNKTEKSIFICFGGADIHNITSKAIQAVLQSELPQKINVVVSESDLINHQGVWPDVVNIHCNLDDNQMADLMAESALIICPASSISIEAASINAGMIAGCTAENQTGIYQFLTEHGLAQGIDNFINITVEGLTLAINSYFRNQHGAGHQVAQSKYFDGKSPERLTKIVNRLCIMLNLEVRSATKDDTNLLFEWVNDSLARSTAINASPVDYDSHKKWVNEVIDNPDRYLYIVCQNSNPIGQIRFDLMDKKAILSYSLDKNYRGKGLAEALVRKGITTLIDELKFEPELEAVVQVNNQASLKIFESNHFELSTTRNIDNREFKVFSRKGQE